MWREKENVFYQEVDVVKDKDLEDVTVEQPIVHHPGFEETGEDWLRLHLFC